MGKSCCHTAEPHQIPPSNPRWRLILWIALIANAAMFVAEILPGVATASRALQPDLLAAGIIACLAIWGSMELFSQSRRELAHGR